MTGRVHELIKEGVLEVALRNWDTVTQRRVEFLGLTAKSYDYYRKPSLWNRAVAWFESWKRV